MQLSKSGRELIKRLEGFRSTAYLDAAGIPTIGYGHKLQTSDYRPKAITESTAQAFLAVDVETAVHAVSRLVRVPLTQGQFDALVSFVYNLGATHLATSTLLAELNHGNTGAAALEFLRWDHCGGRELPSLRTRREAEMRLFMASDPATSPLPADSPHLVSA